MSEDNETTQTTETTETTTDLETTAAAQAAAAEEAEKAAAAKAAEETSPAGDEEKPEEKDGKDEFVAFTADDIVIPEGLPIDENLKSGFLELANKHQLPKEVVTELVDLQTAAMKKASEKGSQLWADTQKQWRETVQKDPDIGGDKLEAHLGQISKLLDGFSGDRTDKVRAAFDFTGAGNHPDVIFFLSQVAAELGEQRLVIGQRGIGGDRTAAQKLYPDQGQN